MPTDADLQNKWQAALKGHECGQSNFLCVKHFSSNDVNKFKSGWTLKKGAVPIITDKFDSNESHSPEIQPSTSSQPQLPNRSTENSSPSTSNFPNQVDDIGDCLNTAATTVCDNCKTLQSELDGLEKEVLAINLKHSVEVLVLKQKLETEIEKNKKQAKEKKSLKNSLEYHKNSEAKLKSIINSLKEQHLISDEAADDLKVIQNKHQILKIDLF